MTVWPPGRVVVEERHVQPQPPRGVGEQPDRDDCSAAPAGCATAVIGRPSALVCVRQGCVPEAGLKAAALLHSLVRNHALVDGNKRIAWLSAVVFLDLNGVTVTLTDEEAFELVMQAAEGQVDVNAIASRLGG